MAAVTVTGGSGYIGRSLIQQLVSQGHSVTALVRPPSRSNIPAGVQIVEGSALDANDVARALSPGCILMLLVTHAQMVSALASTTTATIPAPFRVLDVPAIRAAKS